MTLIVQCTSPGIEGGGGGEKRDESLLINSTWLHVVYGYKCLQKQTKMS